jgi:uncharacterized protein DUF87
MSDRIVLGAQEGGARLVIDLPTLVDSRALITGNSGAGKSRLLRRLCEQAFGKVQIIVIDPEGEFPTLRERHAFLLAGRGGEIPSEPRAAGLMARRLMELRASAVLDLYDLKLPQRREFVRAFLESLMELPRDQYRPVLIVIDEAQLFCPEKGYGEAESSEAVIALMTQGRKRGLCGVPATLRLSAFDKTAAAQATNVFVGRTVLDVDQKRAAAVLGITSSAERVALRDLPQGVFLAYGPAIQAPGVVKFQGGDVETTHPKAGQRHAAVAPPAPDAVRKIAAELKDLPEQAAEEIRTLQAAQARVKSLERELRDALRAQPPAPPAPKTKTVEKPMLKEAQIKRLEKVAERVDVEAKALMSALGAATDRLAQRQQVLVAEAGTMRAAIRAAVEAPATAGRGIAALIPDPRPVQPRAMLPPPQRPTNGHAGPTVTVPVGGGVTRRMLTALAQFGTLSHRRLAMLAGVKRGGSTWRGGMATLRSSECITEAGEKATITANGLEVLGPYDPLPSGRELIAHWRGQLGGAALRAFDEIVKAWPHVLLAETLAQRMNVELGGSTWRGALAALRGFELIPRNELRLSSELEEGL